MRKDLQAKSTECCSNISYCSLLGRVMMGGMWTLLHTVTQAPGTLHPVSVSFCRVWSFSLANCRGEEGETRGYSKAEIMCIIYYWQHSVIWHYPVAIYLWAQCQSLPQRKAIFSSCIIFFTLALFISHLFEQIQYHPYSFVCDKHTHVFHCK